MKDVQINPGDIVYLDERYCVVIWVYGNGIELKEFNKDIGELVALCDVMNKILTCKAFLLGSR